MPECTSDDPTNHQGDTCPIHEDPPTTCAYCGQTIERRDGFWVDTIGIGCTGRGEIGEVLPHSPVVLMLCANRAPHLLHRWPLSDDEHPDDSYLCRGVIGVVSLQTPELAALAALDFEDWPTHLTCTEADVLAAVIAKVDQKRAVDFLRSHAEADDDSDSHGPSWLADLDLVGDDAYRV